MELMQNNSRDIEGNSSSERSTSLLNSLNCFSDSSYDRHSYLATLAESVVESDYELVQGADQSKASIFLKTKKPMWNTELMHWVHNFGGRVKQPCNKNFIVVKDFERGPPITLASDLTETEGYLPAFSGSNRIYIRHGKVRFILS